MYLSVVGPYYCRPWYVAGLYILYKLDIYYNNILYIFIFGIGFGGHENDLSGQLVLAMVAMRMTLMVVGLGGCDMTSVVSYLRPQ